ncbi:hypothetical protein HK405_008561, partial [Cladochytrium tenue]
MADSEWRIVAHAARRFAGYFRAHGVLVRTALDGARGQGSLQRPEDEDFITFPAHADLACRCPVWLGPNNWLQVNWLFGKGRAFHLETSGGFIRHAKGGALGLVDDDVADAATDRLWRAAGHSVLATYFAVMPDASSASVSRDAVVREVFVDARSGTPRAIVRGAPFACHPGTMRVDDDILGNVLHTTAAAAAADPSFETTATSPSATSAEPSAEPSAAPSVVGRSQIGPQQLAWAIGFADFVKAAALPCDGDHWIRVVCPRPPKGSPADALGSGVSVLLDNDDWPEAVTAVAGLAGLLPPLDFPYVMQLFLIVTGAEDGGLDVLTAASTIARAMREDEDTVDALLAAGALDPWARELDAFVPLAFGRHLLRSAPGASPTFSDSVVAIIDEEDRAGEDDDEAQLALSSFASFAEAERIAALGLLSSDDIALIGRTSAEYNVALMVASESAESGDDVQGGPDVDTVPVNSGIFSSPVWGAPRNRFHQGSRAGSVGCDCGLRSGFNDGDDGGGGGGGGGGIGGVGGGNGGGSGRRGSIGAIAHGPLQMAGHTAATARSRPHGAGAAATVEDATAANGDDILPWTESATDAFTEFHLARCLAAGNTPAVAAAAAAATANAAGLVLPKYLPQPALPQPSAAPTGSATLHAATSSPAARKPRGADPTVHQHQHRRRHRSNSSAGCRKPDPGGSDLRALQGRPEHMHTVNNAPDPATALLFGTDSPLSSRRSVHGVAVIRADQQRPISRLVELAHTSPHRPDRGGGSDRDDAASVDADASGNSGNGTPAAAAPQPPSDARLLDQWRRQRLVASLSMRELRKIFPPLLPRGTAAAAASMRHGLASSPHLYRPTHAPAVSTLATGIRRSQPPSSQHAPGLASPPPPPPPPLALLDPRLALFAEAAADYVAAVSSSDALHSHYNHPYLRQGGAAFCHPAAMLVGKRALPK